MIVLFLADGFEEIEALTPADILRRAGGDVRTVSITDRRTVVGAHGISVTADLTVNELPHDIPELVILPGGMPGAKNLDESETVCNTVLSVHKNGGITAAICAAPFILGRLGILNGKNAVCYPGFEDRLIGAFISSEHVVRDGNTVTAAGMGVALQFALKLVEVLYGKEKAEFIRHSVIAD